MPINKECNFICKNVLILFKEVRDYHKKSDYCNIKENNLKAKINFLTKIDMLKIKKFIIISRGILVEN